MKNNRAKNIGITFATFALLMAAAVQTSLNAQNRLDLGILTQSANRIVGAWETTVTPRNCDTGEQVGPPFMGVSTYNEGGTLAEFGANPTTPYRTPGHGIWSGDGRGNYTMKFSFLPLTPAGVPIGRMRVSQTIELSRFSDEMSSSGGFALTNFAGVVIAVGCSTATAVRLN